MGRLLLLLLFVGLAWRTQAAVQNQGYEVYTDSLNGNWADWSWNSTLVFNDTTHHYDGTQSIKWTANAGWAGLFLHLSSGTLSTYGYETLTFELRASQAGQKVAVQLYDANGNAIGSPISLVGYGGDPPAGNWQRYNIPLADLGASATQITGIVLQNNTATAQPALWVDRVGLIDAAFEDDMNSFDSNRWHKNGPWSAGGPPFDCGWLPDHVFNYSGALFLQLDDVASSGQPYSSGEVGSYPTYGYGRIEARMKPVSCSGVITSLFTYTGPPAGTAWHEIDIEFPGNDTTKMDLTYYTNGVGYSAGSVSLGFDASTSFHVYAIEWTASYIHWLVDGNVVHSETGTLGPLPSIPGEIMINCWPTIGSDGWAGHFTYPGSPLQAQYDYIKFTPL